jgi:hypothetical protein
VVFEHGGDSEEVHRMSGANAQVASHQRVCQCYINVKSVSYTLGLGSVSIEIFVRPTYPLILHQ